MQTTATRTAGSHTKTSPLQHCQVVFLVSHSHDLTFIQSKVISQESQTYSLMNTFRHDL